MSEQDNYTDELFEKAKKSPPVLSMSEVKDLLNKPKVQAMKPSRAWVYFSLFSFVFLSLLAWYVYDRNNKADNAQIKEIVQITPSKKENKPEEILTTPELSKVNENTIASVEVEKSKEVQRSLSNTSTKELIGKDVVIVKSATDSIKAVDSVNKAQQNTSRFVVLENEIQIPWFANKETLKMYQDKLLASGIRLEITDVVYNDKDLDKVYITQLNADIMLGDSLYKSIQLKDFKEFRIGWVTYNTGEVRIKSIRMLDKNYVSRKL